MTKRTADMADGTMHKRRFLTLLGGAGSALLAGCTSDTEGSGSNGTPPEDMTPQGQADTGGDTNTARPTDKPTLTEEPTATATAEPTQGQVTLEPGETVMGTIEGEYGPDVGADVEITNTGSAASKRVEATFDWFNPAGDYVDSSLASVTTLGEGETWAARATIPYDFEGDVGGVEVSASTFSDPASFDTEGITLKDTTFRASAKNVVLRGTAVNTRNTVIDYIQAIGKVYDGSGRLLATDYTNELEVAAGASWQFDLEPRTEGRNAQVENGHILLATDQFMF